MGCWKGPRDLSLQIQSLQVFFTFSYPVHRFDILWNTGERFGDTRALRNTDMNNLFIEFGERALPQCSLEEIEKYSDIKASQDGKTFWKCAFCLFGLFPFALFWWFCSVAGFAVNPVRLRVQSIGLFSQEWFNLCTYKQSVEVKQLGIIFNCFCCRLKHRFKLGTVENYEWLSQQLLEPGMILPLPVDEVAEQAPSSPRRVSRTQSTRLDSSKSFGAGL